MRAVVQSELKFRRCFAGHYERLRYKLEDACLFLSFALDEAFFEYFHPPILPHLRGLIMAQRNFKNEFVRYELSPEDIESMREALNDVDDPFGLVVDLIRDGYRVNMRFVEEKATANVVLIPISDNNPNAGFMLSAFHIDPVKALFEVWYIHFVASDKRWSTANEKRSQYW